MTPHALPFWVESCARRLERLADETRPAHPRVAELLEVEARRLRGMDVATVGLDVPCLSSYLT